MTEAFLGLSAAERSEALQVAASTSGQPLHVLEKDVWVVWTLSALFESDFRKHLVFKGGTSPSKACKAIERFSEDIDVTYDIRAIAEDLVEDASGDEPLPRNKTQGKKWSAIHVFCLQGHIKDRLSRHWHDAAKLDVAGHADAAMVE